MLSLITCSRTPQLSQELQDNIAATIGCEYELVTIDNSTNKYNIFQAYNEGVRRAKGDILCFCHDDIMFRSQDWGEIAEKILSNNNCGILGVFGSHFISQAPLYWWSYPYISQYSINTDNGNAEKQIHCDFYHNNLAEVTVVDGVCFFIPALLFKQIHFDEEHFSGFHAYDMDISMQIQQLGLQAIVTKDILIEHFWSESTMRNEDYANILNQNMHIFASKWQDSLPIVRGISMPEDVIVRMNNLCIQASEVNQIRHSLAYRLGKFILHPSISNFKRLINK